MIRKCFAEMFGTFALVFAGTGAIVVNEVTGGAVTHVGIAITFGVVVMTVIYAIGHVSGAHINPAVTAGFWLARRMGAGDAVAYILSQIAGAFLASASIWFLFGNVANLGTTLPAGPASQSFILETVLTAMLMFVTLSVSTGPKELGLMAGIAIGGVIGFEAMFAGPISGASMNPARSLAPAVLSGYLEYLWVYLLAPLLGSAIAVPCWLVCRASDASAPVAAQAQMVEAAG